ncbi:hypothetical protein [Calothrix sp. 336/3]|uniref:hypothetical protein n=1 Tax=Calothrix sp. 336/3 TaxID=1337936 RepID=UPI0004E4232C|nr:hypothetical protein [Calothrix sp. 336/3]AKG22544.1 hypothetical protein IJ00_15815 [Calothrix sp. 336/3]
MSLTDGLVLTIVNTVICLALPKVLSMVLVKKTKQDTSPVIVSDSQEISSNVTVYPYSLG